MKNSKLQTPNSREIPKPKLQMRNTAIFNAEIAEVRRDSQRNSASSLRFSASLCDLCVKSKGNLIALLIASFMAGTPWITRSENLILSNAVVHTISGETIPGGQVLMVDGKISDAGSKISAAAGATVVDLQGQHLYPGIIALDTILGLT